MQKALRTGKVLIDWSQNDEHKTTVNVYSLRAKAGAHRFDPGDVGGSRAMLEAQSQPGN